MSYGKTIGIVFRSKDEARMKRVWLFQSEKRSNQRPELNLRVTTRRKCRKRLKAQAHPTRALDSRMEHGIFCVLTGFVAHGIIFGSGTL